MSKEITKGYRWVVVTGVLDHAKLIANYREALKSSAAAHPNYRRLDLQRQDCFSLTVRGRSGKTFPPKNDTRSLIICLRLTRS